MAPQLAIDRNLLFAALTAQEGLVSDQVLLQALNAWGLSSNRSLADVLVDQGALTVEQRTSIETLVERHASERTDKNVPGSAAAAAEAAAVSPDSGGTLSQVAAEPGDAAGTRLLPGDGAAPQTAAVPGTSPRFRILRPHAKGNLGEVFIAADDALRREVALKEIQSYHAHNAQSRLRFVLEAEVTGGLEHPGIVPVYALGYYEDGRPYYAMRFIKGESLKEAIDRFHNSQAKESAGAHALAWRQLLRRFIDVCNAIAYAHSRGVLHRDLKPSNIMLGKYGETLVVDWGLAKVTGRPESIPDLGEDELKASSGSGVTGTIVGRAIGTPYYMSPEQAQGRLDELGPATDIYSLGATLYCILTGKPPFAGEKTSAVLEKVKYGRIVAPRAVNPHVPRALEAICLKAMAFQPARRYATARDLADDLEKWLADEPVAAHAEPLFARLGRWMRRHRITVAVTAALLATAVVALSVSTVLIGREQAQTQRALDDVEQERQRNAALAEESRRRLVRLLVQNGTRQLEENRPQRALVWFAEALALDHGSPEREAVHRQRLGTVLRQCTWPVQLWPLPARATWQEFSRDGRRLVIACEDGTARVYDVASAAPLTPPLRHEQSVLDAHFSPDGRYLVTGSVDNTARLWDVASGEPLCPPLRHDGTVRTAFSPDGRFVATASYDYTARVWEVPAGKPVTPLLKHSDEVYRVVFNANSSLLATCGYDNQVRIWQAATGKPVGKPLQHSNRVFCAAFNADGTRLVTGSKDNTARVWDVATGKALTPSLQHTDPVNQVAFTPDDKRVMTRSTSANKLWNAASGTELKLHIDLSWFRSHEDFTPWYTADRLRHVVRQSHDRTVRLEDRALGRPFTRDLNLQGSVDAAALSRDGRLLATGSSDHTVQIWDTATARPLTPLLKHEAALGSLQFSADGSRLASVSRDHKARLWDTATGQETAAPLMHEGMIWRVAFSPDGLRVATASSDRTACIWDAATGTLIVRLPHAAPVQDVSFSPDGRLLATGGRDNAARLWQAASGEPVGAAMPHNSWVRAVRFSPDGRRLVTAGDDGDACIWDTATGKLLTAPLSHLGSSIAYAAFSPDGRQVVTCSDDRSARIWDAASGEPLTPPMVHTEIVSRAVFSRDGSRLLTQTSKMAQVWDVASGEPLSAHMRHNNFIRCADFSPDAAAIVTVASDKALARFVTQHDDRPVADLVLLGQLLSGYRINAAMNLEPCDSAGLRQAFEELHVRAPADFTPTPAMMASLHQRLARDAEAAEMWAEAVVHLSALLEPKPDQADLLLRRAQAYRKLGRDREAAADYDRALELQGGDATAQEARARLNIRLKKWAQAEADFAALTEKTPQDGVTWLYRHAALAGLGKWDEADAALARTVQLSKVIEPPDDVDWSKRKQARAMNPLERWRQAGDDLAQAAAGSTPPWWLWRARALAQAAADRYAEAATAYSEALALKADDITSVQGRARAYMEQDLWTKAVDDWSSALRLRANDRASLAWRGFCRAKQQDYVAAVADFAQATQLGADSAEIWFWYGYSCHQDKVRDYAEAVAAYDHFLKLRPTDYGFNNRGFSYRLKHDYPRALADFDEALRLNPNYVLSLRSRAYTRQMLGDSDGAIADASASLHLEPKSSWAHVIRGDAHFDRCDYERAVDDYTAALTIDPKYLYAYRQRAAAMMRLGQTNRAVLDYSEVLRLQPDDHLAYLGRGDAYRYRGDLPRAIQDYLESPRFEVDCNCADAHLAVAFADATPEQLKEVEKSLNVKLLECEKRARNFPEVAVHRLQQARIIEHMATLLTHTGRKAQAEASLRQALQIRKQLVADFPLESSYGSSLARSHERLGKFFRDTGRGAEAVKEYFAALGLREKGVKKFPDRAGPANSLAWFLITCPDPQFRRPARAVEQAERAVRLSYEGTYWNTLALAYYRAGNYEQALAAERRALPLRHGSAAADYLVLALTHWQLGSKEEAARCYAQGVDELSHQAATDELRQLRTEAARLIGETRP